MASEVGPPMDFSVTSLKTVQEAETLICFGMVRTPELLAHQCFALTVHGESSG